jgi:hypothetical protein
MPPTNSLTWKRLVKKAASDTVFASPGSDSQIATVEQALGIKFPEDLRELLLESDGVTAHYGSGLIWSSSKVQEQNQIFRADVDFKELYMPFDHLLFFGAECGGDQFAFAIHADGQIHKRDIFRWKHESDERIWSANCLEVFFERKTFK